MLEKVGGEALEVVFEEKDFEEVFVRHLHGDVPGQHNDGVDQHSGQPHHLPNQFQIAPHNRKNQHDKECETRRYRSFCKRANSEKEIEIKEPEFLSRFEPGIPSEHGEGKWRGQLHVGRSPAGKANHCSGCGCDERGAKLRSRTEAPHVEVNNDDKCSRESRGG